MKSAARLQCKKLFLLLIAMCLLIPAFTAYAEGGDGGDAKVVRVGWPLRDGMTEYVGGVYGGYNYDYLMALSRYTGWTYEFVQADFPACYEMLLAGEIDLVGMLLYSEERAEQVDFAAACYGHKYTTLFTTDSGALRENDFAALDGRSIGALEADASGRANLASSASQLGFSYTETLFPNAETLFDAVADGRVDAGAVDAYMPQPGFRSIAQLSPVPYYFAVRKGDAELLHTLNRALMQIAIERPYIERELYDKYFNVSFDPTLTTQERALIESTKAHPVTVGMVISDAPSCYIDPNTGECAGVFLETLNAVSEKTGLQFSYSALDLLQGAPVSQLMDGKTDLVAGIVRTPRFLSNHELVLSQPVLNDSLIVVGRKGEDFTQDPANKTFALMTGFQVAGEYIETHFPQHQVRQYPNETACLDAVASGEADATVYLRICMNYLIQDPHYSDLEILPAFTEAADTCIAGLSRDSAMLLSIIDKGIGMLSEAERTTIMMNFTTMHPYRQTLSGTVYKYRVSLLIIAVLLLAVIGALLFVNHNRKTTSNKLQHAYQLEQAAYEQSKLALAAAERASAAKGNFMSRMSHEIRTPLNAIIGYNLIARNDIAAAKTEEARRQADMRVMDSLEKSELATRHLLTIINDILDKSAIESGKILVAHDRFDFKNLIASLSAIFYAQARSKGVDFEVRLDSLTEEWFIGDQLRVNQILTNLLGNAIKFTPAGGRVLLAICQPEAETNAAHIRFQISDTGIGMQKDFLDRIWQPFEQADATIARRYGGTGLGLSISKSLVDLMGGSIEVTSEPGAGSVFTVDLTFERAEQSVPSASYDFSGIHALVVDDDESTCDYIRLLFSRCSARCKTVTSGEEALSAFSAAAREGDRFTVCLVDWRMPKMDGVETVRRLREAAGDQLPIIILTAYDFSEIASEAKAAGVNLFVSKPLFQSSFFDLLANIAGARPAADERQSDHPDFSGARVLLVEDNAMNLEVAKSILSAANLVVDTARNGREAVERFAASADGDYRAILMDIQMPEMDGHEATRAIRALSHPAAKTVPIIAMTADAFAENVRDALAAGMNGHISKPIDTQKLFEMLGRYIPRAN